MTVLASARTASGGRAAVLHPRQWPRWVWGPPVALIVLAGSYLLLVGAVLPGPVPGHMLACMPLALVALAPTSRRFAERVAVNGLLLMAAAPVLWWFRWPFEVDHGAAVVAVGVAVLAGWMAAGDLRGRMGALAPRWVPTDPLIGTAGGLALVTVHRWVFASSPHATLAMLYPGYDNVAHFDIFSLMLRHGVTLDLLGAAPDGSAWTLRDYPQGFHALAATYAELAEPGVTSGPPAVVAFAQAIGALVVLGTVVLTAAACSLPGFRRRPLCAVPVVAVICTAFLWEPGGQMLADGFGNFWLACVAGACALVLAAGRPARLSPLRWSAVGACLVVVAHTWAPILIIAGPALLVALPVRTGGRRPVSTRDRLVMVGVLCATALGGLKAAWMLWHEVRMSDVVTADGMFTNPPPTPTLLLMIAAPVVFLGFGRWVRRGPETGDLTERAVVVRRLTVPVLAGVASLTILLVRQLNALHAVSYYFFKYLVGFELVIAAVTAAIAGMALAQRQTRRPVPRTPAVAAVLLSSLLATQGFGPVGWEVAFSQPLPRSYTDSSGAPLSDSAITAGILTAARHVPAETAREVEYVGLGRRRSYAGTQPTTWFHALTGGVTERDGTRAALLMSHFDTAAQTQASVRRLLGADRTVRVAVDPAHLAGLRRLLGAREAARVTTWPSEQSVQPEGER